MFHIYCVPLFARKILIKILTTDLVMLQISSIVNFIMLACKLLIKILTTDLVIHVRCSMAYHMLACKLLIKILTTDLVMLVISSITYHICLHANF